jgi:hypothetical protein
MSNRTGLLLAFATASTAAGIALIVAPLRETQFWNLPTDATSSYLLLVLFALFTVVSLVTPARRDRPLPLARAGAAAVGRAAAAPTSSRVALSRGGAQAG